MIKTIEVVKGFLTGRAQVVKPEELHSLIDQWQKEMYALGTDTEGYYILVSGEMLKVGTYAVYVGAFGEMNIIPDPWVPAGTVFMVHPNLTRELLQ